MLMNYEVIDFSELDELTEDEMKELADDNGWSEDYSDDNTKVAIRAAFDKDRENSIDRKAINDIIDILLTLPLTEDITQRKGIAKFLKYNAEVEAIQEEVRRT